MLIYVNPGRQEGNEEGARKERPIHKELLRGHLDETGQGQQSTDHFIPRGKANTLAREQQQNKRTRTEKERKVKNKRPADTIQAPPVQRTGSHCRCQCKCHCRCHCHCQCKLHTSLTIRTRPAHNERNAPSRKFHGGRLLCAFGGCAFPDSAKLLRNGQQQHSSTATQWDSVGFHRRPTDAAPTKRNGLRPSRGQGPSPRTAPAAPGLGTVVFLPDRGSGVLIGPGAAGARPDAVRMSRATR